MQLWVHYFQFGIPLYTGIPLLKPLELSYLNVAELRLGEWDQECLWYVNSIVLLDNGEIACGNVVLSRELEELCLT